MKLAGLMLLAVLLAVFVPAQVSAATCESLNSLSVPHTTIMAEAVAAGGFTQAAPAGGKGKGKGGGGNQFADLPAFCRVQMTSRPSSDSEIKIEIWLPATGWNGNMEANGNGGWT